MQSPNAGKTALGSDGEAGKTTGRLVFSESPSSYAAKGVVIPPFGYIVLLRKKKSKKFRKTTKARRIWRSIFSLRSILYKKLDRKFICNYTKQIKRFFNKF